MSERNTEDESQRLPSHQHGDGPSLARGAVASIADDEVRKPAALSEPAFRFVQMQSGMSGVRDPSKEVIDKSAFFNSKAPSQPAAGLKAPPEMLGLWNPTTLKPVPAFYPLEKSSRLVEDEHPHQIIARLTECLRTLSIQADYNNESANAHLLTAENVEMHLSLWKTQPHCFPQGIVVELQRRKGDSMAFHRYSRSILDAAVGDWDPVQLRRNVCEDTHIYSKKVQRLLQMELQNRNLHEHENAVIAIEIAHGLLMKDRMDARQLGLESLCLLTDPRKTGMITAVLTSHVVLLGSTSGVMIPGVSDQQAENLMMDEGPFQDIRTAILSLVQFSRLSEDDEDEDGFDVADVGASTDKEHMVLLHNLALAVLANALDVIEHPERYENETFQGAQENDDDDPEDSKPRARLRTSSSTDVANEFMKQAEELQGAEILSTLVAELGKAEMKPHNAALSAKCIGSLCRASRDAVKRTKELGAKNVLATALDVGVRTHLKLELECKSVASALESAAHDQQHNDEANNPEASRGPPSYN